jgi:apolipoprotein D and lipocalin family protein
MLPTRGTSPYIAVTMKTRAVLLPTLALLLILAAAACTTPPEKSTAAIPGVRSIDMDRYLGRWYEIARIPVPVGRSWVNTSDTYSLRPDGKITVVYEGFVKSPTGARRAITGRQWIPDSAVMGDMKVSFLPLVVNDNRVIAMDPDYSWMLVTSSSRDYLWVMSRSPVMDPAAWSAAQALAAGWGFDTSRLETVRQEWD